MGAPLPAGDTVGEIAAFADRQTGQLDKSNSDKGAAARIMETCQAAQDRALEAARKRTGPWWRRVF